MVRISPADRRNTRAFRFLLMVEGVGETGTGTGLRFGKHLLLCIRVGGVSVSRGQIT